MRRNSLNELSLWEGLVGGSSLPGGLEEPARGEEGVGRIKQRRVQGLVHENSYFLSLLL